MLEKIFSFRMRIRVFEKLKEIARKEERFVGDLVRIAVDEFIEKREKK